MLAAGALNQVIFSVFPVGIHVSAMYQMVSYSVVYNRGQQTMAPGAISYSPWTKHETVHSVGHVMTPGSCSCMVHSFILSQSLFC